MYSSNDFNIASPFYAVFRYYKLKLLFIFTLINFMPQLALFTIQTLPTLTNDITFLVTYARCVKVKHPYYQFHNTLYYLHIFLIRQVFYQNTKLPMVLLSNRNSHNHSTASCEKVLSIQYSRGDIYKNNSLNHLVCF